MRTKGSSRWPWLRAGIACLAALLLIAGATLASADPGKRGLRGRPGPRGATGAKGLPGKPGGIALDYISVGPVNNTPNHQDSATATCASGEHVTGGGVIANGGFGQQEVNSTFPATDGTAWTAYVDNLTTTVVQTFTVYAICAPSTVVSLKAGQVSRSKRGRRGPRGPQGAAGPPGDPGSSTLQLDYPVQSFNATGHAQTPAFVDCASGEQPIGGGASAPGDWNLAYLNSTGPSGTSGWFGAEDRNFTNNDGPLVIYPVCTPKPPAPKVAAKRGRRGPRGPRGATGPAGPQGAPGSINSLNLTVVQSGLIDNPHASRSTGDANCPNGQHPTGGGVFNPATGVSQQVVAATRLQGGATGWEADVDNLTPQDRKFRVYAICVASDIPSKR